MKLEASKMSVKMIAHDCLKSFIICICHTCGRRIQAKRKPTDMRSAVEGNVSGDVM